MNGLNEYFDFQQHCVELKLTGEQIMSAWACLDHIREKQTHPVEAGFTLDIIQVALEWHVDYKEIKVLIKP